MERYDREKKLDEANYLLFALGFRLICRLDNVRSPASRPDIPQRILDGEGNIHLFSSLSRLMPQYDYHEPTVPFTVYDRWQDWQRPESHPVAVSMARSPRYAPETADWMMDVLAEYLLLE